jgi:acetyl-CoA synthetase
MSNEAIYPVPSNFADAHISPDNYQQMYRQSLDDPESFWSGQAHEFLSWDAPWHTTCESDLSKGQVRWFDGGQLNASVNCIDRHLPARAAQTAILWEGDDPSDSQHITYQALKDEVCRLANVMHDRGVTAGDRVCIYMPMVPEAAYAMLACTRIGAIHSVVFGGFSPEALKDRINDSGCRMVITADEGVRGGKDGATKGQC